MSDKNTSMSDKNSRRARIETSHQDSATAIAIARALTPDNTAEMETHTDGAHVVTEITRDSTGGLHATIDDYVVNVDVAAALADTTETTTHE